MIATASSLFPIPPWERVTELIEDFIELNYPGSNYINYYFRMATTPLGCSRITYLVPNANVTFDSPYRRGLVARTDLLLQLAIHLGVLQQSDYLDIVNESLDIISPMN